MRNSPQANATWVTARLCGLSLKYSGTKNVKAKAETVKNDLNMEANTQ